MKKLVIHPKDSSTDFLKPVYGSLDATVVTGGVSGYRLMDMIEDHDQVIMLGHGTAHGLMSVGQFPGHPGHIIDDTFYEVLGEKDNSIFIWCNADQYVKYNRLKGFYTGMFISEVGEASMMGLGQVPKEEVDESNNWFVGAVNRAANDEPEDLHAYVKHDYGELIYRNTVAKYNHERLYVA